jgi:hypothetical protein
MKRANMSMCSTCRLSLFCRANEVEEVERCERTGLLVGARMQQYKAVYAKEGKRWPAPAFLPIVPLYCEIRVGCDQFVADRAWPGCTDRTWKSCVVHSTLRKMREAKRKKGRKRT